MLNRGYWRFIDPLLQWVGEQLLARQCYALLSRFAAFHRSCWSTFEGE